MAQQATASPSKPRLSIQTMFLNLLGCTTQVSPVENMCYTTTTKRMTLNSVPKLDLLEEPQLARSESRISRTSKRKTFMKTQSILIGSPSGFQHEYHVTSPTELRELETLRTEVERRVQEAAARHAEMNAFAHRNENPLDDTRSIASGFTSGINSRRTSKAPGSAYGGVKRKPVPSMYPYSPPASWSTATLSNMPTTARSSNFAYSEPGTEPGSSALNSTFSPSLPPSTMASSVEDMPSMSCDEPHSSSSSMKSSPPPSTPPTSSPEMTTAAELAPSDSESDAGSIAPPPVEKEEQTESSKDPSKGISRQPSLFGIDIHFFDFDLFSAEESLTLGAGIVAKVNRNELQEARMTPTVESPPESLPTVSV